MVGLSGQKGVGLARRGNGVRWTGGVAIPTGRCCVCATINQADSPLLLSSQKAYTHTHTDEQLDPSNRARREGGKEQAVSWQPIDCGGWGN
ncbi:unnamed protein product [Protopolystoma xenopodis]|uniref:Uncharacterized protein n=1 Tax=Protopolystoma xenopodis TaxID=117903 RepID=A0A448XRV0_9PLAT|nr:unnamed protein product [Protopolystoma xenopodis]